MDAGVVWLPLGPPAKYMVNKKEISNFAAATKVFRSVELSEKVEASWVKKLLYWNRQQSSTSSDLSLTPRKNKALTVSGVDGAALTVSGVDGAK